MHLVHERAARLRGDLPRTRTPVHTPERGFVESTLGISAHTVGATLPSGTLSEGVEVVRAVVWRQQSELFQTTCRQHV